ncbi:Slp family lipoprotein [Alteromonadaceae bacterium M269]|nr:Slp family lipoprotein [Alteromonadaceae bacterium M269]
MLKKICSLTLVLGLSACSIVPESIQVDKENTLIPYTDVASDANSKKGEWVRWGGVIAEVSNKEDSTVVEMVQLPLRNYGRPIETRQSSGRFRVHVDGFLDPLVFREGRIITFSGTVDGVEEGAIGEYVYKFPKINSEGYELWEEARPVDVAAYNIYPYGIYPYGFVGGRHFIGHGFGHRGFRRGFYGRGFGNRSHGFRGGRGTVRSVNRNANRNAARGGASSTTSTNTSLTQL